jgi:ribonuclease-3
LQEQSQALFNLTPQYRIVNLTGPDHEREFTVEVLIGTQVVGTGVGRSKQAASMSAAKAALHTLNNPDFTLNTDDLPAAL